MPLISMFYAWDHEIMRGERFISGVDKLEGVDRACSRGIACSTGALQNAFQG